MEDSQLFDSSCPIEEGNDPKASSSAADATDAASEASVSTCTSKGKRKRHSKKRMIHYYLETKYNIVRQVYSEQRGWRQVSDPQEGFDFIWTDVSMAADRFARLESHQRYNHFVGMNAITRKNNLGRNLIRMRKFFPSDFTFFPETWMLPTDYPDFKAQFKRGRTYIIKPDNSCQGKGIYLTQNLESVKLDFNQGLVAQTYLKNPYLLDGKKFDLRVYVLVTGCDPLRIYVHQEGLVRLCCTPYARTSDDNIGNTTMHLTNYAVNVKSPLFEENKDPTDIHDGHKRSMRLFLKLLAEEGKDVVSILAKMDDLIIKTLISVQPSIAHVNYSCQPEDVENIQSFEILGFDILLDSKLNPWLLEVNHAPSFGTDSELDKQVKHAVIGDALKLVNIKRKAAAAKMNNKPSPRSIKERATERFQQAVALAVARNDKEDKLGGYRKLYPSADTEAKYKKYHDKAIDVWETLTGGRGRRPVRISDETPVDVSPDPPIILGSPRKPSVNPVKGISFRKSSLPVRPPVRLPVMSARSRSVKRCSLSPAITVPSFNLPPLHTVRPPPPPPPKERSAVVVGQAVRVQTNYGWENVTVERVYDTTDRRLDIRFRDGELMAYVSPKILT